MSHEWTPPPPVQAESWELPDSQAALELCWRSLLWWWGGVNPGVLPAAKEAAKPACSHDRPSGLPTRLHLAVPLY